MFILFPIISFSFADQSGGTTVLQQGSGLLRVSPLCISLLPAMLVSNSGPRQSKLYGVLETRLFSFKRHSF